MGKAYIVLSGKGGVGKTTFSTSIALLLAKKGFSVLLMDADIGLRCADQLLGLRDQVVFDLSDVIDKNCTLQKALVKHPQYEKLFLLAAPQMLSPSEIYKKDITKLVEVLKRQMDYVIIDCPAGIGRGIKNVWGNADEAILIATPDDACLRDTEKVNMMLFDKKRMRPKLVLNRVSRYMIFEKSMKRPAQIAQDLDLELLSVIPSDEEVYRALLKGKPAIQADSRRIRKAYDLTVDRLLLMDRKLPKYARKL